METIHVDNLNAIAHSIKVLEQGGVILYPTDTLYGLGTDATNAEAVNTLREIKDRDTGKPMLAMVAGMAMLEVYAVVTPLAKKLADSFLPGALTLVLEAKDERLSAIAGEDGSLGFRMPDSTFCRNLTEAFGKPIVSTSANRANHQQLGTLEGTLVQLGERAKQIGLVVNAGELPKCAASTIVDARNGTPVILREGALPSERVKQIAQ